MDFVKNAMGGNKDSSSKSSGGNQGTDYVDKGMIHSFRFYIILDLYWHPSAFSAVNDKAGTNISRDNQEKITDFGRNAYEKQTG